MKAMKSNNDPLVFATDLLVEILPEVLSHESEERQERPAEGVEAGVSVIGVPAGFLAGESLRTLPGTQRITHPPSLHSASHFFIFILITI